MGNDLNTSIQSFISYERGVGLLALTNLAIVYPPIFMELGEGASTALSNITNGIISYPTMMEEPGKSSSMVLRFPLIRIGFSCFNYCSTLLGATDLDSSTNTISAANHQIIKLDEVRFYNSGLTSSQVSALYNFGKGDMGNIGEFATLRKIGSTGTSLSTTITPLQCLLRGSQPDTGLSINASTGEITGTPTVGCHPITVIARNTAGKEQSLPYLMK